MTMQLLGEVFLALVVTAIADEFLCWTPRLCQRLVRRHARCLSPELRERYEEEWLAHVNDLPGKLSKLRFAVGTFFAAHSMAHAHTLPNVAYRHRVLARTLDIILGLVLLLIIWPTCVLVALALLVQGKGLEPVVVRSTRVGRFGCQFQLLKFSSYGHVGRFIRRLRFDELPQLVNILRGDMSLVGPRPEFPAFVAAAKRHIPDFDRAYVVRPGLTGIAQLKAPFPMVPDVLLHLRRTHELNTHFIENFTVGSFLGVLYKTARIVLWDRERP
jgi:lipopolysaccharide/colanic/teichoic acid biosynthesis glycosyltransferase